MSQYRPTLIYVDPEDWSTFQEVYERGNVSARIRELVRNDLDRFTKEEVKAQSLAGLTESIKESNGQAGC